MMTRSAIGGCTLGHESDNQGYALDTSVKQENNQRRRACSQMSCQRGLFIGPLPRSGPGLGRASGYWHELRGPPCKKWHREELLDGRPRRQHRRSDDHRLYNQRQAQGAVDPIAMVRRMGVESFYGDLGKNVSGKLEMDGDGARIYVDDEYPRRARFTIAHELGHFVDNRGKPGKVEHVDYLDGTSNLEEFGANEFAGALLMPEDQFRADAAKGWSNGTIARLYSVSQAAVKVRKQTLAL